MNLSPDVTQVGFSKYCQELDEDDDFDRDLEFEVRSDFGDIDFEKLKQDLDQDSDSPLFMNGSIPENGKPTRMKASFIVIPFQTFVSKRTTNRSSTRIGQLSGRVHSQYVFVDMKNCLQNEESVNTDENRNSNTSIKDSTTKTQSNDDYSIFLLGGKRKNYMSRFRRISVNYFSAAANDNNEPTNSQERCDENDITRNEHPTNNVPAHSSVATKKNNVNTLQQLINPSPDLIFAPHLEVSFEMENLNIYSEMRHIAGHIMWCSYINGEKTLIIHGGIQAPCPSDLESSYSNHIYTYSLVCQRIEEPKFYGTWEIPKGKEGHTVHTNPELTEAWIFGGYDGEYFQNCVHYFNASTMEFTYIHPKAFPSNFVEYIPSPRYYHASFFYNSNIYVFGGLEKDGMCSTSYIYTFDTIKRCWIKPIPVPNNILPQGICEHAMCLFKKHYVVLHGGRYDEKKVQENTFVLNLKNLQWSIVSSPQPETIKNRVGHTILNINDQLWIVGGNSALTNHNDFTIMDINVELESIDNMLPNADLPSREIVSKQFEEIYKHLQLMNHELTPEHDVVGKLFVISPCSHKKMFLHFAADSGPIHFRRTLTKYSRLMFAHNSDGKVILKNQRSTEHKSTYFVLSTQSARSSKSLTQATAITLIPEDQVDEHGAIKKDKGYLGTRKKFTKYFIKLDGSETYLGCQGSGKAVSPKILFEPDRNSLFYTLPLRHRRVLIRSVALGMFLQSSNHSLQFSGIPDSNCRLIWLYLELPNGKGRHFLRTISGKFICLDNQTVTLTHRPTPLSIIYHSVTSRNTILISLWRKGSGYLVATLENRQPRLTFCRCVSKKMVSNVKFQLSEYQ